MWGEDDTFGRWVQLICSIPLLIIGAALEYYWWHNPYGYSRGYYGTGGAGLFILGIRCIWYAITGKNNVNRDDF